MIDVRAAFIAGIVAGTMATGVEMILWWILGAGSVETLLRDARFAAAIIMGPRVLTLQAMTNSSVMLVATGVHFALSIVYAALLGAAIERARSHAGAALGALFGLLLYAVNMHGFTLVFPWFTATRDAVTAAAHVAFGTAAGLTYAHFAHLHDDRDTASGGGKRL